MNKKFEILNQDKEFSEKIFKMSNEEEILQAFKEKGIEVSHEELLELRKYIGGIATNLESLEKSELEQIAGGGLFSIFSSSAAKAATKTAATTATSSVAGVALGAADIGSFVIGSASKMIAGNSDKNTTEELNKMGHEVLANSYREKQANTVTKVAQGATDAVVAAAMCYYGKDFIKWWMNKK